MIIALLTDFGNVDTYVASMKSVITSINPSARIIDVTHEIHSYSIREAAFKLFLAKKDFPKKTIFVVVVDPGVGTKRRPLLIKTKTHYYVGPDNGVLYEAASSDGITSIYEIINRDFYLKPTSNTFHGRDIFAITAAWISIGTPPSLLGKPVREDGIVRLKVLDYDYSEKEIRGRIICHDRFGNILTNIPFKEVEWLKYGKEFIVESSGEKYLCRFVRTFQELERGELGIIVDSYGFLEIVSNMESAVEISKFREGDPLRIRPLNKLAG